MGEKGNVNKRGDVEKIILIKILLGKKLRKKLLERRSDTSLRGIEPRSTGPKPVILSVKLQAHY